MNTKDETKKPQSPKKNDLLEGIHFEPSTESTTKTEPTPERAQQEKDRQK